MKIRKNKISCYYLMQSLVYKNLYNKLKYNSHYAIVDNHPKYHGCIEKIGETLQYFDYTDDESFDCDIERGFVRVEWILKNPMSINLLNNESFFNEVLKLSKYSRSCTQFENPNNEYTNTIVCKHPQATHIHVSLPHIFKNENCFNGFYRILNKIWCEEFQAEFPQKFNNNIDYWMNKNKLNYNRFEQTIYDSVKYPSKYTIGNDIYDKNNNICEVHEPMLWCNYKNNIKFGECFKDRYHILNCIPGLFDRNNIVKDFGEIHVEFRGLDHIYHTNEINVEIVKQYGSIQNYYKKFFEECCIPLFDKATLLYNERLAIWKNDCRLDNEPYITVNSSNMIFGMEIETCMDCEKFLQNPM